jgi:hypothetical protein
MPVIHHHVQYPYRDLEKFKERVHKFITFGLIPEAVTLYLALQIALSLILSREIAFTLATIPFFLVYVLYKKRK